MKQKIFDTSLGEADKQHPKLDARLATLVVLGKKAYGTGVPSLETTQSGLRRDGPLAFFRGSTSTLESTNEADAVQVFLTVRETAAFDRLTAKLPCLKLRSRAKTIATAEVRLSDLPSLEASGDVVAVEWTGAVRPASGFAGNVDSSYSARSVMGLEGAPADLDGRGVLVGIVDVEGIDIYHPSFVDGYGRTRLRALWDQRMVSASGSAAAQRLAGSLAPRPYGTLFDHAALDFELSPRQAVPNAFVRHRALKRSHGTGSASLAAGLPFGDRGCAGLASGADLVFVNTWGSGAGALGAMTELADAIAFVLEIADADHRPCVVNVSMGDDLGPRNGKSPIERFIDEKLDAPGRAIVVAAGNSRGNKRHVEAAVLEGQTATLEIEVGAGNQKHAAVEIWVRSEAEGGALDLLLEAPDGEGPTEVIPSDGAPRAYDTAETRVLAISVPREPGSPEDRLIRLEILPLGESSEILAGTWKLHLRARGGACKADAWIDHRYIRFLTPPADGEANTITTPATSEQAITVGAYSLEEKGACWYSGVGPGRGGARRPDLLAPGGPVIVASASTAVRDMVANGTSAAAAIVAGAVALAYQRFGAGLSRTDLLNKLAPPPAGGASDSPAEPRLVHLAHWFEEPTAAPARRLDSPPVAHFNGDEHGARIAKDSVQIMLGTYIVFQEEEHVGWVLVTPGENERHTVEQWLFLDNYRSPAAGVPRTTLTFVYDGTPTHPATLRALRSRAATAIRADCRSRPVCKGTAPPPGGRVSAFEAMTPDNASPISHEQDKKDMNATDSHTDPTNPTDATAPEEAARGPADGVQIMLGVYKLFQDREVGMLYVEEMAGPSHTHEHWILYSSYRWPSQEYRSQQLTFEYQHEPRDLKAFLAAAPQGSTYVLADCVKQKLG